MATLDEAAPGRIKIWITAVRPFAYTASVLAVLLGAAVAYHAGYPIRWAFLVLTLVGVVCVHTTANLLNDCFDHRRGLDTEVLPTSGAVVRGWLTEGEVFRGALFFLAGGLACGLVLASATGWWVILLLGVLGTIIAIGYTTARFCFKYNGLGDAAIFSAFGILPVFGTYWVQTQTFSWQPIFWSVPLCSYTVAILHANNWRDIERDRHAKCLTPAVMLGSRGSGVYYRTLILGPYLLVAAAILLTHAAGWADPVPLTTALALLSLPLALRLARVKPEPGSLTFAMLDGRTAQLHTAFGVLLAVGFFLDRLCSS
ncbi:MAG: 1,4-dihydroxy-2-naphthoate octaprenyltransferase [Lentisphaerae bacterium]|nr:1,4-dihydroxy-2-naphthoate octaprenyltransferase [Lentisphaerota bacterium]